MQSDEIVRCCVLLGGVDSAIGTSDPRIDTNKREDYHSLTLARAHLPVDMFPPQPVPPEVKLCRRS